MRPQTLAGILLVTLLTIASTASYIYHLRNQRDEAIASQEQIKLEAEGFKKALAVKPTEVIKLVPTLVTKYVERKIHEGVIKPIASGRIEGSTDITVPCPPPSEGATAPTEVPVHLTVAGSFLITRIRFGEAVSWNGELTGEATIGEAHTPLTFKPEDTKFDILVSQDIAVALRDHEREGGWWKRHTALSCPGVGIIYNPLDVSRPVNVGITCSYGLVWF